MFTICFYEKKDRSHEIVKDIYTLQGKKPRVTIHMQHIKGERDIDIINHARVIRVFFFDRQRQNSNAQGYYCSTERSKQKQNDPHKLHARNVTC